jgi:hypothetical protein
VEDDFASNAEEQLGTTPLPTHDVRCHVVVSDVAVAVALGTTVMLCERFYCKTHRQGSCWVSILCSSSLEAHNLFIVNKEWSDNDTKLSHPSVTSCSSG